MGRKYFLMLFLIAVFNFSCVNSPKKNAGFSKGKEVFISKCSVCHGDDGKKGLGGASDLTKSNLDSIAFLQVLNYGRKGMPPFEDVMSTKEKIVLFTYLKKLKQN